MQLEQELKEKTADIEKLLERMLPEEAGLQKTIFSAMRYSLMAGGKRIRPLLIAETYRFFGGTDMALDVRDGRIESEVTAVKKRMS